MASRRGGLMVRASPRARRWMVSSRTPRAREIRAQADLAGGGGQGVQVGGGVGAQGAVGSPEQAGVAVPLGLAGDPAGQLPERMVWGLTWC